MRASFCACFFPARRTKLDPFRPQDADGIEIGEGDDLQASEATGEKASGVPPLGIRHFLLWMTFTAGVIAFHRFLLQREYEEGLTDQLRFLSDIGSLVYSIWVGPALVTIYIACRCWRKRERFPTQPGEWLLLIQGFVALKVLLLQIVNLIGILSPATSQFIDLVSSLLVVFIYVRLVLSPRMTGNGFSLALLSICLFISSAICLSFVRTIFLCRCLIRWFPFRFSLWFFISQCCRFFLSL